MKANPGKCHLLLSTKSPEVVSIDGVQITSCTAETLLIPTTDSELNFENHLSAICNTVSRKNNALGRISSYMPLEKRRIVMKTFIESQFYSCPLIWMFHSRTINNKINRLHQRALRIAYSDFKSSFEGLLKKDNSSSIHERNIQSLAIEIYKFLNELSPRFLNNIFHKNDSYNFIVTIFEIIKNVIPEILKQLDMELKLFHIWNLKFGSKFQKLLKRARH